MTPEAVLCLIWLIGVIWAVFERLRYRVVNHKYYNSQRSLCLIPRPVDVCHGTVRYNYILLFRTRQEQPTSLVGMDRGVEFYRHYIER